MAEARQPVFVLGQALNDRCDSPALESLSSAMEVKPGDSVYVVSHGPAEVITAHAPDDEGITRFTVRFPNGTDDRVRAGQILAHEASPTNRTGTRRLAMPAAGQNFRASSPGPRHFEYFGRAFDDADRNIRTSSAVFSLVATMVGGGVLELPYAMSQCGLALGTIALLASAAASAWTLDMLVECARCTGLDTFDMVGHKAYGRFMRVITTSLIFIICWLALVAYFVLLADLLVPVASVIFPEFLNACGPKLLRKLVTCVAAGLLSPMCFKANLHALRFTCYASVCSVLLVALVIGLRAMQTTGHPHQIEIVLPSGVSQAHSITGTDYMLWPSDWSQALYAFPMFGVSFLCHFNALPTHQELQRPTRVRIRRVFSITMCLTSVLYLFMGITGYLFACSLTCGNILLNFSQRDPLVITARVFLGAVLMLNFPLLCQPGRNSFFRLLLSCKCLEAYLVSGDSHPTSSREEQHTTSCRSTARPPASSAGPENPATDFEVLEEVQIPRRPNSPVIHVYRREDTLGRGTSDSPGLEALDQFVPKEFDALDGAIDPTPRMRYVLTALLLLSALALSLYMKSILVVWSVLGATVAFLVAFILPSAFWCRIVGPTVSLAQRLATKLLLWVAIVFSVACTVLTAAKLDMPPCPIPHSTLALQAITL